MENKQNEHVHELIIRFHPNCDLDHHVYKTVINIKKKYGFNNKQLLNALTLFFENMSKNDSNEFPLFFCSVSSEKTEVNTIQERKDVIKEESQKEYIPENHIEREKKYDEDLPDVSSDEVFAMLANTDMMTD